MELDLATAHWLCSMQFGWRSQVESNLSLYLMANFTSPLVSIYYYILHTHSVRRRRATCERREHHVSECSYNFFSPSLSLSSLFARRTFYFYSSGVVSSVFPITTVSPMCAWLWNVCKFHHLRCNFVCEKYGIYVKLCTHILSMCERNGISSYNFRIASGAGYWLLGLRRMRCTRFRRMYNFVCIFYTTARWTRDLDTTNIPKGSCKLEINSFEWLCSQSIRGTISGIRPKAMAFRLATTPVRC